MCRGLLLFFLWLGGGGLDEVVEINGNVSIVYVSMDVQLVVQVCVGGGTLMYWKYGECSCRLLAHQIWVWIMTNPPKCRGNLEVLIRWLKLMVTAHLSILAWMYNWLFKFVQVVVHLYIGYRVDFSYRPLAHHIMIWIMTNSLKCRGNLVG